MKPHNININIDGAIHVMSVEKARELFYILESMLEQIDEFGLEEDEEEDSGTERG